MDDTDGGDWFLFGGVVGVVETQLVALSFEVLFVDGEGLVLGLAEEVAGGRLVHHDVINVVGGIG